ncbi:hypothetical protein CTEN210_11965 [Chaetoceros tenuissimus]|uniref:Uncharacterized protein n=1 Tax=Chaetoceros tenuissimus TaxID=426638 RepID=A0AAD3HA09_9STRA|nr:hypothetical protein CTEN210_11965 [Chaetoceros tenuissimus]
MVKLKNKALVMRPLVLITCTCVGYVIFMQFLQIRHVRSSSSFPPTKTRNSFQSNDDDKYADEMKERNDDNDDTTQNNQSGDDDQYADEQNEKGLDTFNPFRDVWLSPSAPDDFSYSSHTCVNAHNRETEKNQPYRFIARTCQFDNLYYHPGNGTFHYYPSESEQMKLRHSQSYFLEFQESMTVSVGNVQDIIQAGKAPFGPKNEIVDWTKFAPVIHVENKTFTSHAEIMAPKDLVMMVYQPFYGFNIGHLLWDDFLSLFSMLDIFGLTEKQIFPFFHEHHFTDPDPYYRCTPYAGGRKREEWRNDRWKTCTKMYKRVYSKFLRFETHETGDIARTGNWLRGVNNFIGHANDTSIGTVKNRMLSNVDFVRIPKTLIGTGRLGQISCAGDCSIGRASQLYSFRNYLLRNIFYPNFKIEDSKKREGYITFSLPGGSSRPKEVTFFENTIPIAKALVGEDKVKVVDMANVTVQEEARIAMSSALLFVNQGGGSMSSVFMSRGSTVFLYTAGKMCPKPRRDDGYVRDNHWCVGKKKRFDHIFYESAGYIKPVWIDPVDRNNTAKIEDMMRGEYRRVMENWDLH